MSGPTTLAGDVALVTGGGGAIGRATAERLAAQGAHVVLTELPGRGALAEAAVAAIRAAGGSASALALDVLATHTIPAVIDRVARQHGRLDILVNNAGIQLLKPALDLEEEEFDGIVGVNLKGAFLCAQAAAHVMRAQGGGRIVNVASQHGVVGNVLRAAYCASKAGLIGLSRALALEWAPYGIRVNAISPTFVANDSNRALLDSEEMRDIVRRGVPLGRAAQPDDVAWGIVYLASGMSGMVTGHNLLVDGGWTAQ